MRHVVHEEVSVGGLSFDALWGFVEAHSDRLVHVCPGIWFGGLDS